MNFSKLAAYLDTFYAQKDIPGLGCAVYYKHRPVFEHYAGFSDVENKVAFGPETVFRLYSTTKIATCTAALQLMEAGKYRLSDPLYEYLPEFRHMAVSCAGQDGTVDIRPAQNIITIEQLFSMTAGIAMWSAEDTKQFRDAQGNPLGTQAVIRSLAEKPLMFEPGTRFKYGICHDVLGALVEVVSGRRFGAYVKENVLDALGMRDTSFDLPEEGRFCKLYSHFSGKTHTAESTGDAYRHILKPTPLYESGGGGLYSSVRDYVLLAQALCNGGAAQNGARLLKKETVDLMRTKRLAKDAQQDFEAFGGPSKYGYSYGLGVRTLVDRERNNSLSRNGEFGWDGACGCYVLMDPGSQLALFYAQQEAGSQWWFWHGTVRNMAYASVWGD